MCSFKPIREILSVLWTICLLVGLIGCAGKSQPSKFYLLRSDSGMDSGQFSIGVNQGPSVLIGPITLPAYLDRNQVVTIRGEHELLLDEFNRWGESLEDNLYRVLTENLSMLLNTPEIYAFNKRGGGPVDFQILIDVTGFESTIGGKTRLTAFWEIVDKKGGNSAVRQKSEFSTEEVGEDIAGWVRIQNKLLNQFSREIAKGVNAHQ